MVECVKNRTSIMEDVMRVFFNLRSYPFVIPHETLEAMGSPHYMGILENRQNNTVLLFPLKSRRHDFDVVTIPDVVYRKHGAYAVPSNKHLSERMLFLGDVSGRSVYVCEANLVDLEGIPVGAIPSISKPVKFCGKPVLVRMMSAQSLEEACMGPEEIGTVYVTASDIAPGPEVLPDITIE